MKTAIRPQHASLLRPTWGLALVTLGLVLSGCRGPGGPGPRNDAAHPRQPTLTAETHFAGDQLLVRTTLQSVHLAGEAPEGGGAPNGGGGRRPPGGNMGGPPGGGMGGPGGGMGGAPGGGGGPGAMGEPGGNAPAMGFAGVAGPRAMLHVAVTNTGRETLAFSITDVISEIGNFAIRPEHLSLAPGQTAEIDPLGSTYPAVFTELAVEIRLRRLGKTEVQTVKLTAAAPTPGHDQP